MNQRGEASLFCVMILVCLSLLLTLCALELQRSFSLLQKRTDLFLCVKETKGELNEYLVMMGRSNWAVKNLNRARLVMMFIPGMQGAALNAENIRKLIKAYQNLKLAGHALTLKKLKSQGCPIDPRQLLTPFHLGATVYKRDLEGAAILRKKKWTYYFLSKPYLLSLEIDANHMEAIYPKIRYITSEKAGKLSSLLSFR